MFRQTIAAAITLLAGSNALAFGIERDVTLEPLGTYASGVFDEAAAEIVGYDPDTERVFVVNADAKSVDVLDIGDPTAPLLETTIDVTAAASPGILGAANSVAVKKGLVAVAIEAADKQADGIVAVYDAKTLELLRTFIAGALPDAVTFSPNGRYIVAVNEGEPNDDYSVDPEGSITRIDLKRGLSKAKAIQIDFHRFNEHKEALMAAGVRIFGPDASVAQDLEPEFAAVHPDNRTVTVALQENNAFALVDLRRAKVRKIVPLGLKDHDLPGNGLDPSNKDDGINIENWPVLGMYQPDGIAAYRTYKGTFILSANEGDARDYKGYSEEARIKDLKLDPDVFPGAATLQEDGNLGRLKTTTANGDEDGDGDYDKLYSYGARSFSIWDRRGRLVWDSGDELEQILAEELPDHFNCTNDDNDCFDNRSDDKGPEPEGIAVGRIGPRSYAFIGLERPGGIAVYDVTDPYNPEFKSYRNNRNFSVDVCNERVYDPEEDEEVCRTGAGQANADALDLGPEGLIFIPARQSPTRRPLLVVGNEVSGTTTIYQVEMGFTRR